MKLSLFESRLEKQIAESIPGVTPGIVLQVYKAGRKMADLAVGETFSYYDLASLTKIIFTTQGLMRAFDQGRWNLDTRVNSILKWYPHAETLVKDCLNHSAGLKWWEPFYQKIDLTQTREQRWQYVLNVVRDLPLEVKEQSQYSDVGFIVLGAVLEELEQKNLLDVWNSLKDEFYSRSTLYFHPDNLPKESPRLYAPTEQDGWRKRLIQGEVNDDNTWALGGVAPHAGLFGSIDDVSWYALMLRAQIQGMSRGSIKTRTTRLFTARSRPDGLGDWGLGFMMPAKENSLVGDLLSPQSVGHWGFTGTSVWYDPHQDLCVSILSNRTLYGRENKEFNLLRPKLHNWIVEGLRRA